MPSHTVSSALVKLFYTDGAPWCWSVWKDITGIHNGLFPLDDALLPKGFTRQDVIDVESYFSRYNAQSSEDAKIRYAAGNKGDNIPGRKKWRDWVNAMWKEWRIHGKIMDVLTTGNLHPSMIMANDKLGSWPQGETYIPLIVDAVAQNLFGVESFDPSGRLAGQYRLITQQLIQRTWINIHKQTKRSQTRLLALEDAATRAFNNIDEGKLSKSKLSAVIRSVSRWKTLADVFPTAATTEKIEKMEDELKRLMGGLGAKVKVEAATTPGICKVNSHALSSLATQTDVTDIINLYHEFFSSNHDGEANSLVNEPQISISFGTAEEGADPGVEVESTMSPESLARDLGFREKPLTPLLFNLYRHKGGLSPWSHPTAFNVNSGGDLEPLTLFWHQLAGVHAIIRMNFRPSRNSSLCNGTLVADEVGLGKTFQAATVVVFLADLVQRQSMRHPMPPIIKASPYLGDNETIPNYPHLIVVAGTLLSQWESELKTLLIPQSFDIFVYGSGKKFHQDFWSPSGPFYSSKHMMANRIIIASYTALQQDFNEGFFSKANGSNRLPWALPDRLPNSVDKISKTLYSQKYLTITVDEAHNYRNCGPRHSSILLLLDRAELRLILTATPLQTSTKDISAMGRLTGVPHFFSEEAHQEEKNDTNNLRRARKELTQDDYDENDNDIDNDDPVKLCQYSIGQRMQTQFEGRVIRRTINSKDWEGRFLLNIPPYKSIHAILDLTERETALIEAKAEEIKDGVSIANCTSKFATRSFYMEYRMSVGYAADKSKDESKDESKAKFIPEFPEFKSLQEWEPLKSTKMDTCARICEHMLTRDDVPPIIFKEGQAIFPLIPDSPHPPKMESKILIYQEFTSLRPLLLKILQLYNVSSLSIDGQTSFEDRAKIVNKFRTDPKARVLIFSSVGTTGLNLSCANIIIFLDQPWSAQDERQIRGRAHRQPQKKEVLVIHLLANNTADIVLSGMARGKHDMMEAFLSKQSNQDLCALLSGKAVATGDGDESDGSEKEQPGKGKGKNPAKDKAKRRVKKSAMVIQDDAIEETPPTAQPGGVNENELTNGKRKKATIIDVDVEGLYNSDRDASMSNMSLRHSVSSGTSSFKESMKPRDFFDLEGLYNTDRDASMSGRSNVSLRRSVSSDFEVDALYNADKDASMSARSNVSLRHSVSSDASSDNGWRIPRGEELYGTDGNASMYSSSNVSLLSNGSMQSSKPSGSMHYNLSNKHTSTKPSAPMHSKASATGMAVDAPKPFMLVPYSSPLSADDSPIRNDVDEGNQVMEPRYNFIAPSARLPQNKPRTPPPRVPSSGTKRMISDILKPRKLFKRGETNLDLSSPPSPTAQRHTPPPTLDLSSIPYNHSSSRGSSSNKKGKDRARGSEADVERAPSSSTLPRHRQPGSFLSPPPKDPIKPKNPFISKKGRK